MWDLDRFELALIVIPTRPNEYLVSIEVANLISEADLLADLRCF